MGALRINISKLPEGAHQRSLRATPDEVGLDPRFSKDVHVEATLEKTSRQLYLRVEFKTGGLFTCDRCLEEFEHNLSSGYSLVYVTDERSAAGENEEMQVISPDTNYLDLGEDVRQYAILVLPQKMLCREDCAGLCATCGTNLNRATCDCQNGPVDPRWLGLKKFLKN